MPHLSKLTFDVKKAFLFSSDQHAKNSLGNMEAYFLKEQLTDVVIIADDRRIPAHRVVLSAGSEYFAAMFRDDLKEASQNEIELHDIDGNALWALMLYCYKGKIELVDDTVEAVLYAASLLQMTEVVEACCEFLKTLIHPSNCIGIQCVAESGKYDDLYKFCEDYMAENFVDVVKNQEFLMLTAEKVAELLASDDLSVSSEEVVFSALMSWMEHDLPNRTEHVSKLLSHVRLPLLSPYFIVDHIETIPFISDSPECRKLIDEAFKYQLLPNRRSKFQSPRTCPRKGFVRYLYAIGRSQGDSSFSVDKYDMRQDKWSYVGKLGFNRFECGITIFDGKLYIVGGVHNSKTLNTVECYDIKTKTKTTLPPMSTRRKGMGVGFLNGHLYAVGGCYNGNYLNSVERWDPQTNTWSNVQPMLDARPTPGVAVLDGKLYVVGDCDEYYDMDSVERYDPQTDSWTSCASMSKPRKGVGVGVLDGYLYAVGGVQIESNSYASQGKSSFVERYNPKTNAWTTVASLSLGRDSIGVCVLEGQLFAVGGFDGRNYQRLVEAYDPLRDKWKPVASLKDSKAVVCVYSFTRFCL